MFRYYYAYIVLYHVSSSYRGVTYDFISTALLLYQTPLHLRATHRRCPLLHHPPDNQLSLDRLTLLATATTNPKRSLEPLINTGTARTFQRQREGKSTTRTHTQVNAHYKTLRESSSYPQRRSHRRSRVRRRKRNPLVQRSRTPVDPPRLYIIPGIYHRLQLRRLRLPRRVRGTHGGCPYRNSGRPEDSRTSTISL